MELDEGDALVCGGVLVTDHMARLDGAVDLEVIFHRLRGGLPWDPTHEHCGVHLHRRHGRIIHLPCCQSDVGLRLGRRRWIEERLYQPACHKLLLKSTQSTTHRFINPIDINLDMIRILLRAANLCEEYRTFFQCHSNSYPCIA